MSLEWVEQPDDPPGGCGIASLAMLLDTNYVQMTIMAPELCAKCGVSDEAMHAVLAEHGYAVQALTAHLPNGEPRKPWPPQPWADKHLCLVWQSRADFDKDVRRGSSEQTHWLVMDGRGVVYDPALEAFQPKRLRDYYRVLSVAAVVPVE